MSRSEDRGGDPIEAVTAFAPGRVNLIGDHTDYTGGLALPMAINLGTEVVFHPDPTADSIELSSSLEPESARIPLGVAANPWDLGMILPEWGRHVGAITSVVHPRYGGKGTITTTLPVRAGLSSSASLEIAVALALGYDGDALSLAHACQLAEQAASGVRTGILDQLAITRAKAGHALLIDCSTLVAKDVAIPKEVDVIVADSGVVRSIVTSAYAERRAECEAAERLVGPLRSAMPWEVDRLADPVLRRRARHVVSENARVLQFVAALQRNDLRAAGQLMNDSHASLAADFEVSVPELDELAHRLRSISGVFGARLAGPGFGGSVVALAERGSVRLPLRGVEAWRTFPSDGAHLRP
ncbi:MAG TPA: galactokinase family protein [Acidimicrobiales bacterium]|nr:galactokinase family protein [Acidimicrobiales bacterium]